MLSLTIPPGTYVLIGEATVWNFDHSTMRISIDAPEHVHIRRQALVERDALEAASEKKAVRR